MAALGDLLASGLIEKDSHGDVLWTWAYPAVSDSQRDLYMRKCCLTGKDKEIVPFVFGQHKRNWYYIFTTDVSDLDNLPRVSLFSLVLVAKDFNPEKYVSLCKILSKQYKNSGNPASLLECYLTVITKGSCNVEENGRFTVNDFDVRHAYIAASIKDVINLFGVETIILYTALMLKKRVAVYHPRIEELLALTRALPTLVWHRQNWNILYPNTDLVQEEEEELKVNSHYVAGFTDAAIDSRSDLYDVFVNASAGEITIAQHAKDSLAMGKLHKDMAMFMLQTAQEEDSSEQQLIKEIAVKTKELLNNLKSLSVASGDGKPRISLEALRERRMPPATENFLYNLAAAEGLVDL